MRKKKEKDIDKYLEAQAHIHIYIMINPTKTNVKELRKLFDKSANKVAINNKSELSDGFNLISKTIHTNGIDLKRERYMTGATAAATTTLLENNISTVLNYGTGEGESFLQQVSKSVHIVVASDMCRPKRLVAYLVPICQAVQIQYDDNCGHGVMRESTQHLSMYFIYMRVLFRFRPFEVAAPQSV